MVEKLETTINTTMTRPHRCWVRWTALAASAACAAAQFPAASLLFNATRKENEAQLVDQLENLPGLEDVYFPGKYSIPTDFYVFEPPDRQHNYTQDVIFDPCRYYEFNCCNDTYGDAEFLEVIAATKTAAEQRFSLSSDGTVLADEYSRRPVPEIFINEKCVGEGDPFPSCVAERVARKESDMYPRCWNFNTSIVADASCRAPSDGSVIPLCMEVGYTQSAYVVECDNEYRDNDHCGTYLEIHKPGSSQVLADTRMKAVFTSGFRMAALSTTYKGDPTKTLCYDKTRQGAYEVWWVHRTLYNFRVERRVPFRVVSPLCDWDAVNGRYYPYATVGAATKLVGIQSFDPSRLLFTRPRTEGHEGRAGKGMGGYYVPIVPGKTTLPSNAVYTETDDVTYVYTPQRPEYTVKRGILEPPNIADNQIGGATG